MTDAEQSILQAALSLPPLSRAQLADLLWESLPEEQFDVSLDDEIRTAWVEEVKRRMEDVDQGRVELVPGDDVLQRLRAKNAIMRFRFHPEAEAELDVAYDYYETTQAGLGHRFGESFNEALQQVLDRPESWGFLARPYRVRRLKRFPYGIVYDFNGNEIVIIAVMQLHRRPGYWEERVRRPQSE